MYEGGRGKRRNPPKYDDGAPEDLPKRIQHNYTSIPSPSNPKPKDDGEQKYELRWVPVQKQTQNTGSANTYKGGSGGTSNRNQGHQAYQYGDISETKNKGNYQKGYDKGGRGNKPEQSRKD